ncbi:S66 family peptidase [Paenibacillus mendelii]|uniref:S66 peptidase family protein n=1 Tax=Paenibacillus mendelii TaxID=206163 RepID=A0ABV6JF06_9BACL|nr:S66 peptidase family protein [Paenibacillus mendelii]MCQ6557369.1 LD-carboxypeptidase [Paenibacillus mendelii]
MIRYPLLSRGATIGVTAPSSGLPDELHPLLKLACSRMENKGYRIAYGDTVWTQSKAKSAPARMRADEFNEMMRNQDVHAIIPPWGGELLIEILEALEFEHMSAKWILGYSDISLLLLAITLRTGIATAHGVNLIDMRGEYQDATTAMWQNVLSTEADGSIVQHSSTKYQKEWDHHDPSPCVFHLTEPTCWQSVTNREVRMEGRLLGGCVDVIRHLIGTPYGDVREFREQFVSGDPVIWYFENCELTTTDLRRSFVQMKLAGWFEQCSGILIGRSGANQAVNGYTAEDVYHDLTDELQVPIVYDIDCGHVPPQITLINGAYAKVHVEDGKGTIIQHFS